MEVLREERWGEQAAFTTRLPEIDALEYVLYGCRQDASSAPSLSFLDLPTMPLRHIRDAVYASLYYVYDFLTAQKLYIYQ